MSLKSDREGKVNLKTGKNITTKINPKNKNPVKKKITKPTKVESEKEKPNKKKTDERSGQDKTVSEKEKTKKATKEDQPSSGNNFNELEKLYNFMKKYRNESKKKSGKNLPYTHLMTYEPYGKYDIPPDMYHHFKKLYENAIYAGYKPHITEKHKEYGPIVIDLDFVQAKEHSKRMYTNITIVNIINFYNQIIKKYLNVSNNKMDAYVQEKKQPTLRNGEYHDGLHIVYPYICTKPSLQMLMRKDFLKMAEEYNIFKKIKLTNDLETVFDKNVIYNVGWMMYGSRKNESCHPYYVTHIYSTANGKVYDTLVPGENIRSRAYIKHFVGVLSCRRFFSPDEMTPLADNVDPADIDVAINKLKDSLIETSNQKEEIAALMGDDTNFIKAVSEDLLVEAKNLVKLFSKQRATDYYSWYQVGKCLHNIDYRLITDWVQFSKKCPSKFKKGECESLWKKMKPSNYTMATLHYFASKDNPAKYLKMKKQKLDKLIKDGMEASPRTIAKLILEKYKFVYQCADVKHNIWYEYRKHRWVAINSAYSLRNRISDDLTLEYSRHQSYLYDLSKEKQGYDKEQTLNEATRISKVILKLNDPTFKEKVVRECADMSYAHNPDFLKNIDENIYLICFENGVYDLEADIFRDGCPDDYITLCTNYKYIPYDKNDECCKNMKDFLRKIQPSKIMRSYLKKLLSTCLAGSISEESFYVFTGSGANGKSKLMELMKYAMGDLFKPMDIMVLIGKKISSSTATPEIADKKGIRICPFDEPKATDEINTGFMKIFTGGDVIPARALFKEPIYFKPQFKPFLLCNHLPNIKSDDDGTWRRLKVIPFLSKFIKPSEATKKMKKNGLEKGQYWADSSLSEKLPEWKEMFMGMLIKYYQKYRQEGLVHPKLVTKHTAEYRKRCDVFQDFIGDYLDKSVNPKDSISIISLHDNMRGWYRANYEGKCPNTKDLRNYMQQRMPTYNGKTDSLTGYKLKQGDNEELLDELGTVGQ